MVKSERMAVPFRTLGLKNIAVTGELRFDQPIHDGQARAGQALRQQHLSDRLVIVIASSIAGEDDLFIQTIKSALLMHGDRRPFFVYVPRHPNRFEDVAHEIMQSGLSFQRRSNLVPETLGECDVLVGDSLGEMHYYLAMADRVIVGGGFVEKGSHNIIEPLLHEKPVIVGPSIWTIDFPAREAIEAGVCKMATPETLLDVVLADDAWPDPKPFVTSMQGGAARSLKVIQDYMQT
jgi:3-deoxy-D-manno-octulosonic-acid transferase